MSSPINYNDPYLKNDGSIAPMSEVIGGGGGGSELPAHTVADAGKVLMVDDTNNLIWGTVSGGGNSFSNARNGSSLLNIATSGEGVTT